jgi:hypothetical protein
MHRGARGINFLPSFVTDDEHRRLIDGSEWISAYGLICKCGRNGFFLGKKRTLKVSHEFAPHIIQVQTYVLVALVCNERELIESVRLSRGGNVAGHAMRFGPVNLE